MSTEPQTTGSGASGGNSGGGKSAAVDEPRYEREELSEYLGVAPHIVAGALHGERNATFTVAQAQKLVNAFLKHEDTSEFAQDDEGEE